MRLSRIRFQEGAGHSLSSSSVEARSFVLDGVAQSCSVYEGTRDVVLAAKTCERVAMALDLPRAFVLDAGLLEYCDRVLIEANAAWGARLDGCDAHQVLACIASASRARGHHGREDPNSR
ncbi:MAG: ATP-grasp domain-containing protein [Myxococcales bacterium]|nr:ATP-grasp domain-containing protein [Myxococcales bacterium]